MVESHVLRNILKRKVGLVNHLLVGLILGIGLNARFHVGALVPSHGQNFALNLKMAEFHVLNRKVSRYI